MTEAPFGSREKLLKKQQYFQSVHKYTHLKGPFDKITSVVIPLAFAVTCGTMIEFICRVQLAIPLPKGISGMSSGFAIFSFFIKLCRFAEPLVHHLTLQLCQVRGVYNMANGIGKKE